VRLIDTHAHLDQEEFDADRDEVIGRAVAAGVDAIVAVGTTADTSAAAVALAATHSSVWAAVGIQPNYAAQALPGDWDRVVELAGRPKVVALGETGLDRYWDYSPLAVQEDYFDRHLRLSQERGLPFVVHTRDSDAEVLAMLRVARQRGPLRGVMHSFTGTAQTAAECVELGLSISFAGMLTFKKSHDLRQVAAGVPAERLLVETDSPYLSPHPLRGKRNEPAHLVHTAATLAEVRGLSLDELAELTTANARALFERKGSGVVFWPA
jgi:TatD DNase family protein